MHFFLTLRKLTSISGILRIYMLYSIKIDDFASKIVKFATFASVFARFAIFESTCFTPVLQN